MISEACLKNLSYVSCKSTISEVPVQYEIVTSKCLSFEWKGALNAAAGIDDTVNIHLGSPSTSSLFLGSTLHRILPSGFGFRTLNQYLHTDLSFFIYLSQGGCVFVNGNTEDTQAHMGTHALGL